MPIITIPVGTPNNSTTTIVNRIAAIANYGYQLNNFQIMWLDTLLKNFDVITGGLISSTTGKTD